MAIIETVKRKLWASSGGYCGNPDCHISLFSFFETGEICNIEELAHIIGQKITGPRGNEELELSERDEFENIILLCPTCHTRIDKNPKKYPTSTIHEWKNKHQESIANIFTIPKFETREKARNYIRPLLAENKGIFLKFGPYSQNAKDDQMATELMWDRLSKGKIIPNNRIIENAIEVNQHLLNDVEYAVFIEFKLHREGFESNKLSGDVNAVVPRFPVELENIFK